jgi:hypothetical protein
VPPDEPLDEPPPALLLLPLLLQPAAAMATATSAAAIAGVRFLIFMIFLSFWLARPATREHTDPPARTGSASPADSTTHTRESGVLVGGG